MSIKISVFGLLFASCLWGCQAQSPAAQSPDTAANTQPEIPSAHAAVYSAFDLAETAAMDKDGAGLLKAAQQLDALGARPLGTVDDAAKNWTLMARSMGPSGDKAALPFRGRVKGPAYRQQVIAPGETDSLSEIYYAAETAHLSLKTAAKDGAIGTLTWVITETDGGAKPICEHAVKGAPQSCKFTPLWTGQYSIKMTNTSEHEMTYLFVTN